MAFAHFLRHGDNFQPVVPGLSLNHIIKSCPMVPHLNCTSASGVLAPWIKSPRLSTLTSLPLPPSPKVNDGTEDGGPEYLQWSWGRGERRRMMIDRAGSGLSRQTEPHPPKEHHLLSAQVTHSTVLTWAGKGACWEHVRLPSATLMMAWIW